jgi:hypothetical protein
MYVMANNQPTYNDGVVDEKARCLTICEFWKRPSYIAVHYGPIDEVGMKVLQKVVAGIEADIASGQQPR